MCIHHIAIRVDKHKTKNVKQIISDLNNTIDVPVVKIVKYVWFKEKKKKSKLTHYHGQLHIDDKRKTNTVKKKLREYLQKFYKLSKMVNPSWVGQVESQFKYNRYIAKEGDLYTTNWSKEEIDGLYESVKLFKVEQKTPMKQQLLKAWSLIDDQDTDLIAILSKAYNFIFKYHIDRGYLPPTKTLLQQYAMYILSKSNISSNFLLQQVYNLV